MNTNWRDGGRAITGNGLKRVGISLLFGLICLSGWSAQAASDPVITSVVIEDEDIVATVQVPEGIHRVTLESRRHGVRGNWVPRQVRRLSGEGGEVVFRLKQSSDFEILRVACLRQEPLPELFYQGTNTFVGPKSYHSFMIAEGGVVDTALRADTPEAAGGDESREVVESDIWRLQGDRLFFFNQYLGLQLIDVADPDLPVITGTLKMPASGEQMYVLDDSHALLLVHDNCRYWSADAESRLVIVRVVDGQPEELSSVPVQGRILESRLVGSALYLATQSYRSFEVWDEEPGRAVTQWEWGTTVRSYDLADPEDPVENQEHWIPGSGHVIHATSDYLFVSTTGRSGNWWRSQVELIDISSPDGELAPLSRIRPAGRVHDKFKMNVHGDTFTVISEVNSRPRVTRLETYDLSTPEEPEFLGSVDVGKNERLYATRFDGQKAYIVTFFQIDPLWIVDLTDPSEPTVSGELEVPGWSTYIQPLGDRLLSIGIDDVDGFRVAVSLFDVRDPSRPGLLSRVPLGQNNSWSEANNDEKAFGFIEETGLIMVPFSAYGREEVRSGVQLIELENDKLTLRGLIEDDVTPRRTTSYRDRILSISGKSLLTVDATDRDDPQVVSDLTLSWSVDRTFVSGDYLVELTRGNRWSNERPAIRIVRQRATEEILEEAVLPEQEVLGSLLNDGKLYLIQADQAEPGHYGIPENLGEGGETQEPRQQLVRLSVYDVARLPEFSKLGSEEFAIEEIGGVSDIGLHFTGPDTLSAVLNQNIYWISPFIRFDIAYPYWGGQGRRVLTFGVEDPESLELFSDYSMTPSDAWDWSEVLVHDRKLYMSYRYTDYLDWFPGAEQDDVNKNDGKGEEEVPPELDEPFSEPRTQLYYLSVLDLYDPENPTEREPVNIPGMLVGMSRGDQLIYTRAPHWDARTLETDWRQWLDVGAYDGVSFSLVDSYPLSTQSYYHPVVMKEDLLHVGIPEWRVTERPTGSGERNRTPLLRTLRVNDDGEFESVADISLGNSVHDLRFKGDLLLGRSNREYLFFGFSATGLPELISQSTSSVCYGYNLAAADATLDAGLWIPMGDYGVTRVGIEVEETE